FPRELARRGAPAERLRRARGPGHTCRQRLRRRGHRPRAAELLPARSGVRRAERGRGRRGWSQLGGAARAIVCENRRPARERPPIDQTNTAWLTCLRGL